MPNFPEWAPKSLIEWLERLERNQGKPLLKDPEQTISDLLREERFANLNEEEIENLRVSVYRHSFFLPNLEEQKLLRRSLTDLRMKNAWAALQRREKTDQDYSRFWSACTGAILSWRGEQKYSAKEQREFYQRMYDHTTELQSLIAKSKEFQFYSINRLIKDSTVEWLIDTLDAHPYDGTTDGVGYARFCLSEVIPSIHVVLIDIAKKAKLYAEQNPVVLKPRSENAHVHYFVRSLSNFLREYYDQPLHEVVAITASVLLDKVDIDAGLVRKLVT